MRSTKKTRLSGGYCVFAMQNHPPLGGNNNCNNTIKISMCHRIKFNTFSVKVNNCHFDDHREEKSSTLLFKCFKCMGSLTTFEMTGICIVILEGVRPFPRSKCFYSETTDRILGFYRGLRPLQNDKYFLCHPELVSGSRHPMTKVIQRARTVFKKPAL